MTYFTQKEAKQTKAASEVFILFDNSENCNTNLVHKILVKGLKRTTAASEVFIAGVVIYLIVILNLNKLGNI